MPPGSPLLSGNDESADAVAQSKLPQTCALDGVEHNHLPGIFADQVADVVRQRQGEVSARPLILPEQVPIGSASCIDLALLCFQVERTTLSNQINKRIPTRNVPELMAVLDASRLDISSCRPNGSEKGLVGDTGEIRNSGSAA